MAELGNFLSFMALEIPLAPCCLHDTKKKNTVFSTEISWLVLSVLSEITHLSVSFLGPLFIPVLISCGLLCLNFLLMEFYPRKGTSALVLPFTALSPERTLTRLRSFLALRLDPVRLRLYLAIS